jgi:hypothetical protein
MRVLVQVAFRNIDANDVVHDEVKLFNVVWILLLDHRIISHIAESVFIPYIELLSIMNGSYPIGHKVKIVMKEVASLCLGSHNPVVLTFLEEPLGLTFFKQDTTFLNVIQLNEVALLLRKLTLVLVGDKYSLDWIDVQIP